LGLPAEHRRWLKRAALLHDIGKLGVSNSILDKAGKLDDDE
jgi:HD-GYP domain-containing protein (c-di-GMP phosphodiesterase class II)